MRPYLWLIFWISILIKIANIVEDAMSLFNHFFNKIFENNTKIKISKSYILIEGLIKSLFLFKDLSIIRFKVDKQVHEFEVIDLISMLFEQ